jgi:hypothetical protein
VDAAAGGCGVGPVGAEGGVCLRAEREKRAYELSVADAPEAVQLESIEMDYTRSRIMATPWPTPTHIVHRA